MSKMCPNCKGTKFQVVRETILKRGVIAEIGDDGAFKVLQEGKEDKIGGVSYTVLACSNKDCKTKLTEDQLISVVKCSVCGEEHQGNELINGICTECTLKSLNLVGASPTDILRRLVEATKVTSDTKAEEKVQNKIKAAEKPVEKKTTPVEKPKETEKVKEEKKPEPPKEEEIKEDPIDDEKAIDDAITQMNSGEFNLDDDGENPPSFNADEEF